MKRTDQPHLQERPVPQPRPVCAACQGNRGKTVNTSAAGVFRQHWETCDTCQGTGLAD